MKKKKVLICFLLFSSIVYVLSSLYLGRIGYGFYFFKQKLPYNLNVSYDEYNKFHIKEHDIIYALSVGDSIPVEPDSRIFVVKSIDRYTFNISTNFIAFEFTDTRDSIIKAQYKVVKEMVNGSRIRFTPLNKDLDSLKWIDVRISENLFTFLLIMIKLSVLSIITLTYCLFKVKDKKEHE